MSKYLKFEIISTILIMLLGVLLHFTYEWSQNNLFISLFSSINESVWEHLKLIFYPYALLTFIGYFIFHKEKPNYLCYKTKGIIISLLFTIIFFYTYTGVLGYNITFLDISSFFLAIIIGQITSWKNQYNNYCNLKITTVFYLIMIILFSIFTFYPPNLGLFHKF